MQVPSCLCGSQDFATVFTYHSAPPGEVQFDFGAVPYFRQILRCNRCGHFVSVHDIDMRALYTRHYVNATYGADGLRRAFDRIVSLQESASDNVGRVEGLREYCGQHFNKKLASGGVPTVLDVGSGLCVFLHRLHRLTGWPCTALDPDKRAAMHAIEVAGVGGMCADFMQSADIGRFDLITFNKVLEHVADPVAMLARAREHLMPGGLAYVELPDGEIARTEGYMREEFFIDHHHVFSLASIRTLAERAGFQCEHVERLREPSSKYTLRAFLTVVDNAFRRA